MPDSPINYDVLFRWEAADGLAGELAARGEATVIAEVLAASAARFTAEHTTGMRFSVPELEEPETEGPYPAPNAEMAADETLGHVLDDMVAIDNLYRATRRFGQEWEDEPRKELGLLSARVREAFEELSAAAAELGGRDPIWQEVRRA